MKGKDLREFRALKNVASTIVPEEISLYKMHGLALHGFTKVALDTVARMITRRTEPHVKLH